jgi:NAD-dependent deacetylase
MSSRQSPVGSRQAEGPALLADLLRSARSAVVLTGAGISVPSGIPDFRSPGTGIWEKVDPMEVAHIDVWRRDPDRFWHFYGARFASLREVQPNPAHAAVAELERRGLIDGVITQNIDRLHRAAGSREVVEVHGSIEWSRCPGCGARVVLERVVEMIESGAGAPECPNCVTPLKPEVVLFGEMLPMEPMVRAEKLAAGADLMICIGSSLTVHPVAALPELTLAGGGQVAVITESDTPYDDRAAVRLGGDVVDELEAVLAAL